MSDREWHDDGERPECACGWPSPVGFLCGLVVVGAAFWLAAWWL